jgi:hypothetical protein
MPSSQHKTDHISKHHQGRDRSNRSKTSEYEDELHASTFVSYVQSKFPTLVVIGLFLYRIVVFFILGLGIAMTARADAFATQVRTNLLILSIVSLSIDTLVFVAGALKYYRRDDLGELLIKPISDISLENLAAIRIRAQIALHLLAILAFQLPDTPSHWTFHTGYVAGMLIVVVDWSLSGAAIDYLSRPNTV